MLPGELPSEDFRASQTGRTRWRDCISHAAYECLRIPPGGAGTVLGTETTDREEDLTQPAASSRKRMDGWMEGE